MILNSPAARQAAATTICKPINGTPRIDPLEQAMKIVEAEKMKANTYAEQLRIQREKEETPYNFDQDFSFLKVCKMGKLNETLSNPLLNPILQDKASAAMKPTAPSPTSRGRSVLEHIIYWKEMLPTSGSSHTRR